MKKIIGLVLIMSFLITGCLENIKPPSFLTKATPVLIKAIDLKDKYETSFKYWTKVKRGFNIGSVTDPVERAQLESAGLSIDRAFAHVKTVVYESGDLKDKAVVITGYAGVYNNGKDAVETLKLIYNKHKSELPKFKVMEYDNMFSEFDKLISTVSEITAAEGIIKWTDLLGAVSNIIELAKKI
jgi:hypothetical protein